MSNAIFYHADRPTCVGTEQMLINAIVQAKYPLETADLGQQPSRIDEAEAYGVKSVPALLMNGQVFHINFGAALANLKS